MSEINMENIIVSVCDLEKSYVSESETLTILKDLQLSVVRGSKTIITGESGCGKSTLLNIIGGLDTATAGKVIAFLPQKVYQVHELDENTLTAYRSFFLGLIFQFHHLLKDFTALENVFLPAYMGGMTKKIATERAKQLLCDVGLTSRMYHYPSQLSGGERQRVSVARSLINDPQLVLADEPTGNLDPLNAASITDLLFSVVEKYAKTIILVTHDMELAKRGDVCYRLEDGKLVTV